MKHNSIWLMFALISVVCLPLVFQPGQALAHAKSQVDKPPVSVYLNGKLLSFSHTPYLKQNHTLVPVRDFLTALGVDVQWNPIPKTITASQMDVRLILKLSSQQAIVNGKNYSLPLPVHLNQGKAFAPLRVLAEAVDAKVHWQASDRSVRISTGLSYHEAEQLVRKHLKIALDSKTIVEYDHDDEEAYVIHVYDWVQPKGQPGMTVTQGWYKVHSTSGKIQSLFE